jgi:nonribosomal peptide synthetase DhbF
MGVDVHPADGGTSEVPYRAPQNGRQERLCEIFADVLHLPRVGADDDFFELGGQSIDGVLITTRANTDLGCQLSLADLFDAPSVAALDQLLDETAGRQG